MKYYSLVLFWIILGTRALNGQVPAQTLPDFKFSRMDQTPFEKKDLARGKMIFFFFFDCDCEHCQRTMENIDRNYPAFLKTASYLISTDDHDKVNRFIAGYSRHFKDQENTVLLLDNANQFIAKFKPVRYPAMYLYSTEGNLIDYEDNEETVFRIVNQIEKRAR